MNSKKFKLRFNKIPSRELILSYLRTSCESTKSFEFLINSSIVLFQADSELSLNFHSLKFAILSFAL